MNWKNLADRTLATFLQTFTAVLVAAGTGYTHIATLKGAAISGGAAVLALLKNVAQDLANKT